jgi:hypothetical protein
VENGGGGGAGGTASGDPNYSFGGGGGGGGAREAGKDGTAGGYLTTAYNGSGGAGGPSATDRGYDSNPERRPNVGGAGAAAGGLGYYLPIGYVTGPGAGGGGGGALTVQGAGDVTLGGSAVIDASGGAGGTSSGGQTYYAGGGGGGGGGSVLVRGTGVVRCATGAAMDVTGGAGGAFVGGGSFSGGVGGAGGAGYVRVEAKEDDDVPGSPDVEGASGVSAGPVSTGIFAPTGTGEPSVGQTTWIDLGVFEPEMVKPGAADVTATLYNDELAIWVQMAVENPGVRGTPDLSALDIADADGDGDRDDTLDTATLSEWTKFQDIESLNGHGYQLVRIRIEFTLDPNQAPADPLPFLDRYVLRYVY